MKRKLVAAIMSLVMAITTLPVTAMAASDTKASEETSFAEELESKYVDPDRVYSSDVRWWLGSASATDDTLLEEIQALYDLGFRGVELCMQSDGVASDEDYAYGSEMWSHKWKLMMNKLLDLGMGVYLTSGTNWASSNVPESEMSPASQEAMQILCTSSGTNKAGEVKIKGGETYNELLGTPEEIRENTTFLAAYAYKLDEEGAIIYGEDIDLSDYVTVDPEDGTKVTLNWTAPEGDNEYMIVPLWTQGSYETSSPAVEPCYTTNYFDKRGVEALKKYWEKNYLSDPELNEKIMNGDVQLFMDSLEITYGENWEGFTWWSEDIRQEFIDRKGYDILPYIIMIKGLSYNFELAGDPYYQTKGLYDFSGDNLELNEKIINDWEDVLTQLYEENFLAPLKEWLNSVGIKTRAQITYGRPFEITEPSQYVDYPEAENLNQYDQIDIFRLHTAGAKLLNKTLSTETGGTAKVYGSSSQELLHDVYTEYAAGFQRVVWHIWTAQYGYGNCNWPGYMSGFGGGTAFYRWGTRNPISTDYDEFNAHIGRVQELMQTGKSRTDIGFVYNNWAQGMKSGGEDSSFSLSSMNWMYAHMGVYYRSTELQDNGYTYDYFSPDFLFNDEVYFDPETKTIESAGYKALVIWQDWLDIDGAEKILELAKQGMPVVIVDGAAVETPFNDGKDEELAQVMAEMKKLDNVRTAAVEDPIDYGKAESGAYDDEVYEKLQELGVEPYAEFDGANQQLLTQSRVDDEGNMYLYVYNYCPNDYHEHSYIESVQTLDHGTNIKTNIKMQGHYIPYEIDAWTGEVTELAEYSYEDGQTIFPIDLDYDNIKLYAFEKVDDSQLSITSTDAASAYTADNGDLVIRATESGKYTTTLSSGNTFTNKLSVPDSYDITDWDLTVTSWTANEEKGDLVRTETIGDLTTVNKATSTVKTDINVKLDKLTTWDNIEEVGKNVSGTGHYEATFNWDSSKADGAYLDFGDDLMETMKVWINGKKVGGDYSTNPTKAQKSVGVEIQDGKGGTYVPEGKQQYTGGINWKKPVVDIGDYLVDGENTIVIEYNSNLTNVALANHIISESHFGGSGWTACTWWHVDVDYRSYGPQQAVIVPYSEAKITKTDDMVASVIQMLKFNIRKVSLKTIESSKRHQVTIAWHSVKGADGYRVKGSLYKSMKKAVSLKTTKTSLTVNKLPSKVKVYVEVRGYKTIGGLKVYTQAANASVKVK